VIETARLRLRRFSAEDYPEYEAFFADADASRFCGGPLTPDAAWMRFCAEIGHWSAAGYGVWAMEAKSDRAFVGGAGFWRMEGWGVVELTWFVLPGYRRRGYGREASRAVLSHAYDAWGWTRVETIARDENDAVRGLIADLGGTVARRERFPDGVERDVFSLPRPEQVAEETLSP
jgi:RimJ/RimL family protein N-acetyltransferase